MSLWNQIASYKSNLTKVLDQMAYGNYRPVSILSVISNILEKAVYNQLEEYLSEKNFSTLSVVSNILEKAVYNQLEEYLSEKNLIYNLQSGFRGSLSTDTCLIYLTDYIKSQIAAGKYTGMVILDLQKAFDTVDHEILCSISQAMGIHFDSVKWLKSCLSNRQQVVKWSLTHGCDMWRSTV